MPQPGMYWPLLPCTTLHALSFDSSESARQHSNKSFFALQAGLQWAHTQLGNASAWYLLATAALHTAACSHQALSCDSSMPT